MTRIDEKGKPSSESVLKFSGKFKFKFHQLECRNSLKDRRWPRPGYSHLSESLYYSFKLKGDSRLGVKTNI